MKLGDILALLLFLYALLTRKRRRYTASWWQRTNKGQWEYQVRHFDSRPDLLRLDWFDAAKSGRYTMAWYMVTKRRGL